MTARDILNLIRSTNGTFFSVVFTKRTTGETRRMCCRLGVRKHLKNGDAAYDFASKGLVSVWDRVKKEYRCVPLDGVVEIRVRGKTMKIS